MTLSGIYDGGDRAAAAADAIRRAGLGDVAVYAPMPDHRLIEPASTRTSPVRLWTLLGGLTGLAVGVGLPVYTMLDWPLIVGGRPTVSIPPIVVIAFELSMLGAAVGGFLGFLVLGGLPRLRPTSTRDHRFTNDRYGVVVRCADGQDAAVRAQLERAGAEEVRSGG